MTIGYHAPPPRSRTGVADYAETLRQALEQTGLSTSGRATAAVQLYHLGNNGLHTAIYDRALRVPGVIVLHDAVLHHFLLGRFNREEYVEEFVFNYGRWCRELAEEFWAERAASGVDARYFEYPMLRRIVSASRAVVVHNPAAARMAEAHGAAAVHVIPHFLTPAAPADHAAAARFRQRHGIAQNSVLFGIFGYLRETKRLLPCVRAFKRLHAVRPNTDLFVAGEAVSGDLRRLLDTEAEHPAIHRAPFLSEHEFRDATAALDCCLNLRYPGAGETSGITVRMAAAGVPLIVTDSAEASVLPQSACLRVRSGVAEAGNLFDYMSLVAEFPHLARAVGNEARRHMANHHSLPVVARRYRDLLCSIAS